MAIATLYRTEKKIKPIEAHRPTLTKHELVSVLDCLIHDQIGSGTTVERFEKSVASTFKYRHVLAVNSLASGYHLAFLALGIGKDDTVLMSAAGPVQACDGARYTGASVQLMDLDRNSFHVSMERTAETVEKFTAEHGKAPAAIVMDHSFGSPSPLNVDYFKEKDIKIVEDFTSMVGHESDGVYSGNAGSISVCGLSEYDLLTTGNGSLIVTADSKLFGKLASLRYGTKRSENLVAYDYRLEDFQAAMGLDQLSRLGVNLARRRRIAQKYLETLSSTKHETYFQSPGRDCYLKFPVLINRSHDEVFRYFRSLQIGVERAVEFPLHALMGLQRMEYPNTERLYQKAVAIPIYPALTANNVERVASSLRGLL